MRASEVSVLLLMLSTCTAQEVECLCVLPRLMVLDLVGNPLVASTEGYRLLLLYRLSCLKVLDGAAADATELAAAQAQHAGRLTISLLVGHTQRAACLARTVLDLLVCVCVSLS